MFYIQALGLISAFLYFNKHLFEICYMHLLYSDEIGKDLQISGFCFYLYFIQKVFFIESGLCIFLCCENASHVAVNLCTHHCD